jgi:lipid II:glycine glycyltransferase (peptidoglycan interpeptide bridge formation enzyme)
MKELISGYKADVDSANRDAWNEVLSSFEDSSLYQTWDYNEIRSGLGNISNIVLKKNDSVISAAQVRIFRFPIINIGIAYVYWGPLWHPTNFKAEKTFFSQAIRALRNEYVCKRGLALRIFPVLFNHESEHFLSILREEDYSLHKKGKRSRTLLLSLTPSIDELRKGLEQKWRNCLNRAERNSLEIIEGQSDELFEKFKTIYRQMLARKQFIESNDIDEFSAIQKKLQETQKMKIMLCKFEGKIAAGAIFSAIGKTGIYIFGATNENGMKSNGSYLLQWKFIEWLKQNGYILYDLNGINPEKNPGTYRFKAGLCGKNGKDVTFLGQFNAFKNSTHAKIIECTEAVLSRFKRSK